MTNKQNAKTAYAEFFSSLLAIRTSRKFAREIICGYGTDVEWPYPSLGAIADCDGKGFVGHYDAASVENIELACCEVLVLLTRIDAVQRFLLVSTVSLDKTDNRDLDFVYAQVMPVRAMKSMLADASHKADRQERLAALGIS